MGAFCVFSCKVTRPIADKNQAPQKDSIQIVIESPQAFHSKIAEIEDTVELVLKHLKDTISFIGVGDIMIGTNFPSLDYLPPNNGEDLWREVRDTLKQAYITFGNLEGVILNEGGEPKECKNPAVCCLFRTPIVYASNLVDAGFDIMSLANNHAGDFGDTGRQSTTSVLDSLGISYAGLLSSPFTVLEKEDFTIGFAAFIGFLGCLVEIWGRLSGMVAYKRGWRSLEFLFQFLENVVDLVERLIASSFVQSGFVRWSLLYC